MYFVERNIKKRGVPELLLIVVCAFTFFVHNGMMVSDIMEARNLTTAHEMVADGNWLMPTLNGEPRYAKPPLPTWVAACVELVSPENIVMQRAMAGLMATALVLFLYYFTLRLTKSKYVGVAAGMVLATSINVILMSRTATWDIYCHAFMLGAILCFVLAYEKAGKNYGMFALTGLLMGLSYLGKGPVSFFALLFPFFIAYFAVFGRSRRDDRNESKALPVVLMVAVALVVAFWWQAVLLVNDKNALLAISSKEMTSWVDHSVRPWWYYWRFFVESGVWSVFLLTALLGVPYLSRYVAHRKQYVFAVVWCVAVLVFLSCVPEKKTRYLLPILVPSALMVGHLLYFWWNCSKNGYFPGKTELIWKFNAGLLAFLTLILPAVIYFVICRQGYLPMDLFYGISALLLVTGICLVVACYRNDIYGFCSSIVLLFVCVVLFVMPSIYKLFSNPDRHSIHAVTEIRELDNVPFYHDKEESLRIEIVYEARRKILPCAFSDSLPAVPFAVVHAAPIDSIIPAEVLQDYDVRKIGTYDDNPRPQKNKLHTGSFVKTVTLVREKE